MTKPPGRGWFKLGEVGVDSGQLLLTDPCYLGRFKNDDAPSKNVVLDTITGIKWQFTYGRPADEGCTAMPSSYAGIIPNTNITFNEGLKTGRLKEIPPPEPSHAYSYRGCCELTCGPHSGGGLQYDMGHMGQGVVFSSGYGDGCYEVWGRRNAEGRIVEVRVLME